MIAVVVLLVIVISALKPFRQSLVTADVTSTFGLVAEPAVTVTVAPPECAPLAACTVAEPVPCAGAV
jgi:hypothetical protein